jgi:hypothetical protein
MPGSAVRGAPVKPAIALAAAAQSLPGRADVVWLVRRVDRFVGLTSWLLGFVVVLLGWQIALLLALLGGIIELGAYAGIHFFGCFVLAACLVWRLYALAIDNRYSAALQIVAWSALAGPFGAFVAVALSLPAAPIRSKIMRDGDIDGPTTDWPAIERVERMYLTLLDRRVRLEGACRIRPLMDVIAEGSQSEKFEALAVVYRRYEARLSAVLKRAMRDPDTSVRVLAATVTAKLHATYSRKIGDCQTAAAAKSGLAQNWRNLAEARLAYAESGLLEAARARPHIEFAVGDLSRAAELDPADRASAGRLDRARRQLQRGGCDFPLATYRPSISEKWN